MAGRKRRGDPPVAKPLLEWYERSKRDLPWRREPTPYRVWVSEVMLQQTRVEVVVPRFESFLRRFPDLETLAGAGEEEVLSEWSGLGYYRRARALHAAARLVLSRHGGAFPRDLQAARALPGVGRYTAGAVLSIAYDLPLPVLDGNVARVLARLFRIGGDPRGGKAARRLWDIAAEILPAAGAGSFNQAMMELGARICLPLAPRCGVCPLAEICQARREGQVSRFPFRAVKRAPEPVSLLAGVVERRGKLLLEMHGAGGPGYLRGMWGFPILEAPAEPGAGPLCERLRREWGLETRPGGLLGRFRHSITYRRITLCAFRLELLSPPAPRSRRRESGARLAWARPDELGSRFQASSLALKVRRLIESEAPAAPEAD
jgi:A/G-specific adenine glycosylase